MQDIVEQGESPWLIIRFGSTPCSGKNKRCVSISADAIQAIERQRANRSGDGRTALTPLLDSGKVIQCHQAQGRVKRKF